MIIEEWTNPEPRYYRAVAPLGKGKGRYILRVRYNHGYWFPSVSFALGPTLGPGYCPPGFPDRRQAQERAEKAARHHARTGQWHSGEK